MNTNKKIAIIGCGAAGTTFFLNLIDRAVLLGTFESIEIIVIEKTGDFGPGLAYSTQYTCNLMNTPSTDLGIPYGYKLHFWTWVIEHEQIWRPYFPELTDYNRDTALPRALYGLYLKQMFTNSLQKAKKSGIKVHLLKDVVTDIECVDSRYQLSLTNECSIKVTDVCCCVGLGKQEKHHNFSEYSNYFCFPGKDEQKIAAIPRQANVTILGTRLSAIDSILMLKHNAHQGKISAVSRTGNMPNVVNKHVKFPKKYLTRENLLFLTDNGKKRLTLRKFLKLLLKEYRFHEGKKLTLKSLNNQNVSPIILFRLNLIQTYNNIRPWQAAFYNTNDIVNLIWQLLTVEARQIISKYYLHVFQNQRIAMPRTNAQTVYALYRKNQLDFYQNLKDITYRNGQYHVSLYPNQMAIVSDYIIDAAGLTSQANSSDNLFIKNLLRRDLVVVDEFGMLKTAPDTLKVLNDMGSSEQIYILGGLIQGTYIAANLMESIVELSMLIVADMLEHCPS